MRPWMEKCPPEPWRKWKPWRRRLAVPFVCVLLAVPLSAQQPAPVTVAQGRTPDIHFTPTRHNIADAMLQLAKVGPGDVVYDLGSGDGRIPIIAAQKYGARGIGIEIDPQLVDVSWRIANEGEVAHRVSFIVGDLFTADVSQATVITAYLSHSIMKLLEPKLRALSPGTRIVSHHFPMAGWPPDRRIKVDEAELMLWVVPPR